MVKPPALHGQNLPRPTLPGSPGATAAATKSSADGGVTTLRGGRPSPGGGTVAEVIGVSATKMIKHGDSTGI